MNRKLQKIRLFLSQAEEIAQLKEEVKSLKQIVDEVEKRNKQVNEKTINTTGNGSEKKKNKKGKARVT